MDLQTKSGRRVLVVDDDRTMRVLLSAFLRAAGYEVEVAAGGEEALALLAPGLPDLVLLDYMMSGMSGPEVLLRMRAEPRMASVPILMLTGVDLDARVEGALPAGADGYLRKPVDRRSLLARVDAVLQGRAAPGSGTA
jgi:two-component system phosphate regulon response regulator PhoB